MKLLVTILNIFLLMVGLFIHISTYFHLDISKYTILEKLFYTSVLFLGFGLFIFMFVNFKMKGIEITPLDALNKLPNAVKVSIIIFFIITLVVFVSISVLLSGGGTQIIDGQYFLTNRGIIIRAITEVEFNKYQFLELRMSSIMFLLFCYINTISYFFILKNVHWGHMIRHIRSNVIKFK